MLPSSYTDARCGMIAWAIASDTGSLAAMPLNTGTTLRRSFGQRSSV